MDDFLKKNNNGVTQGLTNESKKIEFKFIKEQKTSRTYIYNLEYFVRDDKALKDVIRNIKISLGTACIKKDTEFGLGYGFNGDFSEKIKTYLLENNIVDKEAFK
jgi:hypothetical protein